MKCVQGGGKKKNEILFEIRIYKYNNNLKWVQQSNEEWSSIVENINFSLTAVILNHES